MTLTGGYFIWKVRFCENGDPDRLRAAKKRIYPMLIKIADGAFQYRPDNGFDYVLPVVKNYRPIISPFGDGNLFMAITRSEAEIAISALNLGIQGLWSMPGHYSKPRRHPLPADT